MNGGRRAAWFAVLAAAAGFGAASCRHLDAPDPEWAVFFRFAPDGGAGLPADRWYPQGRMFPASFYSVGRTGDLDNMRRDGFTGAGPDYGRPPTAPLEKARRLGGKTIARVGVTNEFRGLPDEEVRRRITAQVAGLAGHEDIAWWCLAQEELRYWRKDEAHYLAIACDAIRRADPRGRPVFMYEPCHSDSNRLAHTVIFQDLCAKGMYVEGTKHTFERVWCRWSMQQMLDAIRGTGRNAVPVIMPEMATDPPPDSRALIGAWCRHDVYTGLLLGGKAFLGWSGFRRSGFTTYDAYYAGYASVIRDLNGPLNLATVFLFGERREGLNLVQLEGPATVACTIGQDTRAEYPAVLKGDFAWRDRRYLFLVNSADRPVRVRVTGLPVRPVERTALFEDTPPDRVGPAFEAELGPWAVRGWMFRAPGQSGEASVH